MPTLDRIIEMTYTAASTRNEHGESVPGAVYLTENTWAQRNDAGVVRKVTEGGVRTDIRRTYRVRWTSRIQALVSDGETGISRIGVTDEGETFRVFTISEVSTHERRDVRRRYFDLEAVA